jgi:hypothetical protein
MERTSTKAKQSTITFLMLHSSYTELRFRDLLRAWSYKQSDAISRNE